MTEYGIRWMRDDETEWHYEGGLSSPDEARAALRAAIARRDVGTVETLSREPGGEWQYDSGLHKRAW